MGVKNRLFRFLRIIRSAVDFTARIFWLFPVLKGKVLFISQGGRQFSCNPKYIYLRLMEDCRSLVRDDQRINLLSSCYWVFKGNQHNCPVPMERRVRLNSLGYLWHLATTQMVVTNHGVPKQFALRKEQTLIQTWHGGGAYKRVSTDVERDSYTLRKVRYLADRTNCFVSSCRAFTKVMSQARLVPEERFLEVGMPRNDVFFDSSRHTAIRGKILSELRVPVDARLVLYAPTFRDGKWSVESLPNEGETISPAACVKTLSERFGGKWIFLYRSHHNARTGEDIFGKEAVNASRIEDMQELLVATDVLITDYSSSMWDFSLTFRPCFLFAPDLNRYSRERDFYTPIDEWPFPVSSDNKSLCESILSLDMDIYRSAVKRHHSELGSLETGEAARKVCDFIYSNV